MATLVLTRRAGEAVWIGPDVRVMVGRAARDGSMRLIIDAPLRIKIIREEIRGREPKNAASASHGER